MRIYISGPMTNVKNYKENFARAEKQLRADGHEVINPAAVDMILHNASYEEYMKVDMFLLDMCDAVYMLKGWQQSCGANREYGYALAKDYHILEEDGNEVYIRK